MASDKNIKPYEDAAISFEEIDFSEFQPTQLYVLQNALVRQAVLHDAMSQVGIDTFHLDDGVLFRHPDTPEDEHTMIPPIVEYDDKYGLCLLDGTHRSFTARSMGEKSIGAILISGVPSELPITSYPNQWEAVSVWEHIPEDLALKRHYRLASDHSSLYRDLSGVNNSAPRQAGEAA